MGGNEMLRKDTFVHHYSKYYAHNYTMLSIPKRNQSSPSHRTMTDKSLALVYLSMGPTSFDNTFFYLNTKCHPYDVSDTSSSWYFFSISYKRWEPTNKTCWLLLCSDCVRSIVNEALRIEKKSHQCSHTTTYTCKCQHVTWHPPPLCGCASRSTHMTLSGRITITDLFSTVKETSPLVNSTNHTGFDKRCLKMMPKHYFCLSESH